MKPAIPLIKVKAVTHRRDPIMQSCIGPSEEHVNMAGIPTEASILGMTEKALPGNVKNVYAHCSGGGKYMAVIQFVKKAPPDEGRQRQAALLAFSAFSELKHVILVDDDVDLFDTDDVLWALNTRFQGDVDVITIPGVRCHPLDPSQSPEFSPSIRDVGISCKTIFDCTVPFGLKEHFQRSKFKEVDPAKWVPELFKNNSKRKIPEAFMLQVFFFCIPNASSFTACHCLCLSGLTSLSQNSYFNWKKYSS